MPPGYVQLETDWTFTREDEGGVRLGTHDVPGTLVRDWFSALDGAPHRLEWLHVRKGSSRIFPGARARHRRHRAGRQDSPPVGIGRRPTAGDRVSEWVHRSPPATKVFPPGGRIPRFCSVLSHSISERVGLGYNVGMAWESGINEAGRRHHPLQLSLFVGCRRRPVGSVGKFRGGVRRNSWQLRRWSGQFVRWRFTYLYAKTFSSISGRSGSFARSRRLVCGCRPLAPVARVIRTWPLPSQYGAGIDPCGESELRGSGRLDTDILLNTS